MTKCCLQLDYTLAAYQDVFQFKPTNEIVPFVVQVGLIGQAALHHVEAESVAGLQGGHSSTQWAVPLAHQPTDTLRIGCQLKHMIKACTNMNQYIKVNYLLGFKYVGYFSNLASLNV